MDIVVCVKAVCMSPIRFEVSQVSNRIDCGSRSLTMNEVDEYAVEQALVTKKELGGNVTVVSVGGLASQDVLYVARAKGADRAIRVATEHADPVVVSELLAKVIKRLNFHLVLTGVESSDEMTGQTGICLAEKLGLPSAYAVTGIEVKSNSDFITVRKELGGGIYQVLEIQLPAMLCVQSGIQPLKYAPPAKVLRARREPLEVFSEQELMPPADAGVQQMSPNLVSVFKPEVGRKAEYLEGTLGEIAAKVVEKIL